MSAEKLKHYRFADTAQWESCLLAHVDRAALRKSGAIGPLPPYDLPGRLYESDGARIPAVIGQCDVLWLDEDRRIHRTTAGLAEPESFSAPAVWTDAGRIVATAGGLWVIDKSSNTLQRYDDETFARLLTVEMPDMQVLDIASGGRNTLMVLVEREKKFYAVRMDRGGRMLERDVELRGLRGPIKFVFLRRERRHVVLDNHKPQHLLWYAEKGGSPLTTAPVADVCPCGCDLDCLGSDVDQRLFLACSHKDKSNPKSLVAVFDGDGKLQFELPLDQPAMGIAASRDSLFVAGRQGLRQFAAAQFLPVGVGPVGCEVMTQVLFSPDREDRRRWLRIEADAVLPNGSSLEISWVTTDDEQTKLGLNELAHKTSILPARRIAAILSDAGVTTQRLVYHGSAEANASTKTFTAKLFDVDARYLWVRIALASGIGGQLPRMARLEVIYPGRTLMENLPAIFQREESGSNSYLRSLVGVLETTTQGLDDRIATLGELLGPSTADENWLNFVARWLSVPWDDALPKAIKRKILKRAGDLAKWRGTRAGLEILLECLVGDSRQRFRVIDAAADYGFAVVGGGMCTGSTLPAVLAGRPRWSAQLDSTAVVGYTRLPCQGRTDDGLGFAGKIRVAVAATGHERQAWEPWLQALLSEMVPLGARLDLCWVAPMALHSNRLDGTWALDDEPVPNLGSDAITNWARLPDKGHTLSACGPIIGMHLR
jgi:phage tail-like protein